MMRRTRMAAAAAALMLALGLAAPARAQVFTGRIDVTIEDPTGGRLPGVTVDLTGPIDADAGRRRAGAGALPEPAGRHLHRQGDAARLQRRYTNNNVEVLSGASTPLVVQLGVAGAAETVNVTAVTPAVDVKRATTTTQRHRSRSCRTSRTRAIRGS